MKVSYLTDVQVREQYLLLLSRIDEHIWDRSLKRDEFWFNLGYSRDEIPDW